MTIHRVILHVHRYKNVILEAGLRTSLTYLSGEEHLIKPFGPLSSRRFLIREAIPLSCVRGTFRLTAEQ